MLLRKYFVLYKNIYVPLYLYKHTHTFIQYTEYIYTHTHSPKGLLGTTY